MADKKFVGTFQSENQVLKKIEEFKVEGYSEEDIYVVTNHADSLSIVRGQTDVELKSSDGNWLDRFIAFLNGDEPVRTAFCCMLTAIIAACSMMNKQNLQTAIQTPKSGPTSQRIVPS